MDADARRCRVLAYRSRAIRLASTPALPISSNRLPCDLVAVTSSVYHAMCALSGARTAFGADQNAIVSQSVKYYLTTISP